MIGAIIDKLKGKAKQLEGKLTGDKVRTAQGTVEEAKGDVEIGAAYVAGKVKRTASRAKRKVETAAARAKAKARR